MEDSGKVDQGVQVVEQRNILDLHNGTSNNQQPSSPSQLQKQQQSEQNKSKKKKRIRKKKTQPQLDGGDTVVQSSTTPKDRHVVEPSSSKDKQGEQQNSTGTGQRKKNRKKKSKAPRDVQDKTQSDDVQSAVGTKNSITEGPQQQQQSRSNKARDQQKKRQAQPRRTKAELMKQYEMESLNQLNLKESLKKALDAEVYTCSICCDNVRFRDAIWSCDNCYGVLHLKCVSEWAQHSVKSVSSVGSTQSQQQQVWRCPNCQHQRSALPKKYFCFCGKLENPAGDRFMSAHSCGQQCQKLLGLQKLQQQTSSRSLFGDSSSSQLYKCPHKCTSLCHAGPCDPCDAMAPPSVCGCYCGKTRLQLKCRDLIMDQQALGAGQLLDQKSCGQQCDKMLSCGKHKCQKSCHAGNCGPCSVTYNVKCYCGQSSKDVLCVSGGLGQQLLPYQCGRTCGQAYACGVHRCALKCHSQSDSDHSVCPLSPQRFKACPCGRQSSMNAQRYKCIDPIMTCDSQCPQKRTLHCGHQVSCKLKCHYNPLLLDILNDGDQMNPQGMACHYDECQQQVIAYCRCGSQHKNVKCVDMNREDFQFLCDKVCNEKFDCKRHKCQQVCCKLKEHKCEMVCGKQLPCGLHKCQDPCHKGKCRKCTALIIDYDDNYVCSCGRTVMAGPVRCGQELPSCPFTCTRPRECGHYELTSELASSLLGRSGMRHPCHPPDTRCPTCLVQVLDKRCVCGRETAKWYCGRDYHCQNLCGKQLPNCHHKCTRGCHSGDCQDIKCMQVCGLKRKCGHPCRQACHDNSQNGSYLPCDEISKCDQKVKIACNCGNIEQMVPCFEASKKQSELHCTEECEIKLRNARLANALQLTDGDLMKSQHKEMFSQELISLASENLPFVRKVEALLASLAKNAFLEVRQTVVHRFNPMKWKPTMMIKMLLNESYIGFEHFEEDSGPNKSLVLKVNSDASVPLLLLSAYIEQLLKSGISIPPYDTLKSNDVNQAANYGSDSQRKTSCPLRHHHFTASRPMLYESFLQGIQSQWTQLLAVDNAIKLRSILSMPEILQISVPGIHRQKIGGIVDDFMQALRDEMTKISSCSCRCDGCSSFPTPVLVANMESVESSWQTLHFTSKELYIINGHLQTGDIIFSDEGEDFGPLSIRWETGAFNRQLQSSGKWMRKVPNEPLDQRVQNYIMWSLATLIMGMLDADRLHRIEQLRSDPTVANMKELCSLIDNSAVYLIFGSGVQVIGQDDIITAVTRHLVCQFNILIKASQSRRNSNNTPALYQQSLAQKLGDNASASSFDVLNGIGNSQ
ncbi:hypothetical protein MP228_006766 [Amoeboaphelidium protococcarum]|nr:hypothetical protein MP228_006766 [Amoeboaphelidium protococcarum]